MLKKYTNVKSKYIKNLIQKTNWNDKAYIDDLINLHKLISTDLQKWGFAGGILFHHLKDKYDGEYLILLQEYAPERYWLEIERRKQKIKLFNLLQYETIHKEVHLKHDWTSAGGKL